MCGERPRDGAAWGRFEKPAGEEDREAAPHGTANGGGEPVDAGPHRKKKPGRIYGWSSE